MGALRLLAALLAALRLLRLAIPRLHPIRSLPRFLGCAPRGPGLWYAGVPPALPGMETTSSPRFLGHPFRICPALRPRPGRRAKPSARRYCPRLVDDEGPNKFLFRGSITQLLRSLSTLHRPGRPIRRKTRFRLPLRFTGWDWLPTGWLRTVSDATSHHPPFPDFAWRDDNKVHPRQVGYVVRLETAETAQRQGLQHSTPRPEAAHRRRRPLSEPYRNGQSQTSAVRRGETGGSR